MMSRDYIVALSAGENWLEKGANLIIMIGGPGRRE